MDRSEDQKVKGRRADDELQAVDALVDTADGDLIWRVLDHAQRHAVSVAVAYRAIVHDAVESGDRGA